MMGHREKLSGGVEWDALNHRARRFYFWRAGMRKLAKRKFNKRTRRLAKVAVQAT